jgi:hypothetical protein
MGKSYEVLMAKAADLLVSGIVTGNKYSHLLRLFMLLAHSIKSDLWTHRVCNQVPNLSFKKKKMARISRARHSDSHDFSTRI